MNEIGLTFTLIVGIIGIILPLIILNLPNVNHVNPDKALLYSLMIVCSILIGNYIGQNVMIHKAIEAKAAKIQVTSDEYGNTTKEFKWINEVTR